MRGSGLLSTIAFGGSEGVLAPFVSVFAPRLNPGRLGVVPSPRVGQWCRMWRPILLLRQPCASRPARLGLRVVQGRRRAREQARSLTQQLFPRRTTWEIVQARPSSFATWLSRLAGTTVLAWFQVPIPFSDLSGQERLTTFAIFAD